MTPRIMVIAAAITLGLLPSWPLRAADDGSNEVSTLEGAIEKIAPILKKYNQQARIDFHSDRCGPGGSDGGPNEYRPVKFPGVKVNAPNDGGNALAEIASVFRDDPSVAVSEDESGLMRVRIGKISKALLSTKIAKVQFSAEDQFNVDSAFAVVEDTPEMRAAMLKQKRHPNIVPYIGAVQMPMSGLPHLPPQLRNTSYGAVLDLVAQIFNGVVSHGECDNPGRIDTIFTPALEPWWPYRPFGR